MMVNAQAQPFERALAKGTAPELAALGEVVLDNLNSVWDFPTPGVLFRDIAPLLANPKAFEKLIDGLADYYRGKIDMVAGLESRGFLIAAPLAKALGVGMLLIRKAGKLPGNVIGFDYALEYGTARLELQPDSVPQGARFLVVDDVLATGGTARAAQHLIEEAQGEVASFCVLMELEDLEGRQQIPNLDCQSLNVL